jgi:hypothetical protein
MHGFLTSSSMAPMIPGVFVAFHIKSIFYQVGTNNPIMPLNNLGRIIDYMMQ